MSRTVWVGPVSSSQVHAPAGDLFIPCVGATARPGCADLDLASVLASKGVKGVTGDIVLHGFSAGGDAIKKFLKDPAARARTTAVVTHDATFQGFGSDEGFVAYGTEAAQGLPGRVFVATTSSAGSSNLRGGISDSASMEALRQKIEVNTGQKFQSVTTPWAPKPPVKAWKLGGVVFLDFGTAFTHAEHVTVLAPLVFDNVVAPMLAAPHTSTPPVPSPPLPLPWTFPPSVPALSGRPVWPAVLVVGGAGIFLYALVRAFK